VAGLCGAGREYLAGGMTDDAILSDLSNLTRDDIRAALAFAAARQPLMPATRGVRELGARRFLSRGAIFR
jgi:Protein of unknown function (DUF433)